MLSSHPYVPLVDDEFPSPVPLVDDEFPWPQTWMDDWLNDTERLFNLFGHEARQHTALGSASPESCVVWKTNNISPRHKNTSVAFHHPSSFNGVHHWLNRMAVSVARRHKLGIVDLSATTASLRPAGANMSTASEGDVYHGYDERVLGRLFLQELATACCGDVAPTSLRVYRKVQLH